MRNGIFSPFLLKGIPWCQSNDSFKSFYLQRISAISCEVQSPKAFILVFAKHRKDFFHLKSLQKLGYCIKLSSLSKLGGLINFEEKTSNS